MLWLIVFCALCVTTARTQVVETPTVYDFLGQGRFLNDKPSVPMGVFAGLVDRQLPIRVFECDWGAMPLRKCGVHVFFSFAPTIKRWTIKRESNESLKSCWSLLGFVWRKFWFVLWVLKLEFLRKGSEFYRCRGLLKWGFYVCATKIVWTLFDLPKNSISNRDLFTFRSLSFLKPFNVYSIAHNWWQSWSRGAAASS